MEVSSRATRIRQRTYGATYHIHIATADAGNLESSIPWSDPFVFLIPVLATVLQVHCQGSSPFHTHPPNMWTFLFSTFIYCLALGRRIQPHAAEVAFMSGSLASAALVSVMVPRTLEHVIFILNFIFLITCGACNQIRSMGKNVISYVTNTNKWKKITGNSVDQATTAAMP